MAAHFSALTWRAPETAAGWRAAVPGVTEPDATEGTWPAEQQGVGLLQRNWVGGRKQPSSEGPCRRRPTSGQARQGPFHLSTQLVHRPRQPVAPSQPCKPPDCSSDRATLRAFPTTPPLTGAFQACSFPR